MTVQAKIEATAANASYVTNGAAFTYGAITLNQMLALIGALLAIATFFVNLYFQRRRDRRETELHITRMRGQHDAPPDQEQETS